ncbi:DNA polymerase I [Desulfocucumis palustris]|uniref:DNA polymerase I n=2 Tax=Desulfocucumis palustris TaxID=1898651 RepID=A0A2L2XIC9_9FIRM|nr:DNA polymerase I [Desulfocucumis palustris]
MPGDLFMVIDGNSLAHRAFHAIPALSTSKGVQTNAVYGFTTMLLKILDEKKPGLVAVCFDKGKITFRHDHYSDYKAHRKGTPDDLRPQFPLLKKLLETMRITILEEDGYEADDLIGALTTAAEKHNISSVIVTGDRDALQLVSPLTRVLLTKKGITELDEYDEGKVWEKYGISPEQLIDFKGLVGDASDNIPGVPGIGEKTASKLIKEYGSLEELIEKRNDLTGKIRAKMEEFREQALLSKKLATIIREIPVAQDMDRFRWQGPDYAELLALFSELEFKTLIRSILNRQGEGKKGKKGVAKNDFEVAGAGAYTVGYITIDDESSLKSAAAKIKDAAKIALALEGDRKSGLKAAALSIAGNIFLLPLEGGRGLSRAAALAWLKEICGDPDFRLLCHNAKEDMWRLKAEGIKLEGIFFDTMIAAYLLNPATSSRELTEVALEYLKIVLPSGIEAALPARAEAVRRLHGELSHGIEETGMDRLYYEVELPLVTVLAEMEMTGVKVDRDRLNEMSLELGEKIQSLSAAIHSMAGEEFNINSTKQLGYILFERLQLPVIKRTKTGYSTDAAVLEELAGSHEIVAQVLEHRQMVKLKSTYVDGFSPLIDPETGLLHTTFHQDVTATGRLSSAEPNLQNIPIKMEEGRKIRKVFLPRREGNIILSADYSQIELRILAHMSADPLLVEAFRKGEDIHARTASEVFGVRMEQVTREMRGRAKAVNFGIIYGISDFGLSRDIKVPRREAKLYIEGYFNRYRGVKNYIDRIVAEAREKGYVTTLLNRRRYLPDLFSSNHTVRSFGERTAMNTPIQGTAADIIKMAMVRIQREIVERGLATKMILQVHDELIFDVPLEEFEEMKELVKTRMENALALDVPLVVDMKAGQNWYEVKVIK